MPIIITSSDTPPDPPVEVTSPDGYLTARRDDPWAGVLLIADFPSGPAQVRFTRTGPDGVEVPVRGGDVTGAPGGVAVTYDHEAPLGVSSAWHAYPIGWDGTVGARSDGVAVTPPEPTTPQDVWLKSLSNPALSMRVTVMSWPTLEYGERQERLDVLGASSPVMRVDAWSLATSSVTIETATLTEREQLLELILSGSTLLAQTRNAFGRPDAYWVPGKISESMSGPAYDPHRTWEIPITAVDRPTTVGAPTRIPGRSYDDSTVTWPTYADRTATGQTYLDVTTGG
ncbi:hypothetical protein ABT034_33410 [Streptomyces sp. NPDC002773]|uniref:hypothetical protein n=1 Tax=Streptomyces sp. NPDC002773 TaxID=3154430 RepID=UPI00331A528E